MALSRYVTTPYIKEELVTEMGASFLSRFNQIDSDSVVKKNASYLDGWLKELHEDSKFIFKVL